MTIETIIPAQPGAMAVFCCLRPDGTVDFARHQIIAWRIPPHTDPVAYPVLALSVAEDDMNSPHYIPDPEKMFPGFLAIVERGRLRIVSENDKNYHAVEDEAALAAEVRASVARGEHTFPPAPGPVHAPWRSNAA